MASTQTTHSGEISHILPVHSPSAITVPSPNNAAAASSGASSSATTSEYPHSDNVSTAASANIQVHVEFNDDAHPDEVLQLTRMVDNNDKAYAEEVRTLLAEYIRGLGIDMAFQDVSKELAELPGAKYTEEHNGAIYILSSQPVKSPSSSSDSADAAQKLVGVIALKDLGDGISEAKRLFVRPEWRGRDFGRLLLIHIIDIATQAGYTHLRLDTLARFTAANKLYAQLGFKEIEAYNYNPEADIVYFELSNLKQAEFKKGREELYSFKPRVRVEKK